MTETISPKAFYELFLAAAAEHGPAVYEASIEGNATFTQHMFSHVFSTVAKRLGCNLYREYYTFGGILYREKNTKHFSGAATHVKNIAVALEHENIPGKSVEEMHKLQLLNTPLKVLVTYPPDHAQIEPLLDKYREIIREADVFADIGTLRRQLVIFGFVEGRGFTWRGFVYDGGKFVE